MAKRKIPEVLTQEEQQQLINIFNTRYLLRLEIEQ